MNKILFIDDDKDVLNIYRSIFQSREKSLLAESAEMYFSEKISSQNNDETIYVPFLASQGEEGINIFKKELASNDPIKAVFIDMRMPPGINGVETASQIRKLDERVEIVFVTAFSDTNLEEVVKEVGHPDKLLYLKKPFDICEIKQMALNLVVKYKNENIKNEFVSNITHELKTPLASIIGFHELLESSDLPNNEIKEYVSILGQSAKLMKSLIDDLVSSLELSHIGMNLYQNEVNLNKFVNQAYLAVRPLFANTKLEFSLEMPDKDEHLTASIDEGRILQCINNLISNAIKFTNQGGVVLGIKKIEGKPAIFVKDSGIGIEDKHIENIFNKFFRIENKHHNIPGLGLGLNIVKNIMDLHKGRVDVISTIDQGSEFQLKF